MGPLWSHSEEEVGIRVSRLRRVFIRRRDTTRSAAKLPVARERQCMRYLCMEPLYPIIDNEEARNFCATFGRTDNLKANMIHSDWLGTPDSCVDNAIHTRTYGIESRKETETTNGGMKRHDNSPFDQILMSDAN